VNIADAKPANEGAYNVIASLENCRSELSNPFFITDVLEAPIAVDTSFIVSIDSSLMESIVIGNYNSGIIYDITILTQPEQGEITISQGPEGLIVEYLPNEDAIGTDIVSYSICPSDCPDLCDNINSQGTIEISVIQSECIVNNVITPDNDGFNDELIIDCLKGGGIDLFPDNELIILNQWGDEIFRAAPYQNNWDGTYEGNPVPDGTYFYIFREGPEVPLQKGFITVFR
jgi:gliding motility-associated-like protein